MEFRRLGSSGFKVPVLSLGTGTFGGKGMLKAWGASDVKEARRLIDICLEAGLNMFDSADVYSSGAAERFWAARSRGSAAKTSSFPPRPPSAAAHARTTSARRATI
jgi:aryl-alcohol dehydrogenase-like predicted oxidoreductase